MVDGVPAAAEEQQWQVVAPHEADALGVAGDGQVLFAEPVAGERVAAALHHDGLRLEYLHDLGHDGPEQAVVPLVVHALVQRHVNGAVLALPDADVLREPLLLREEARGALVERHRHHAGGVDEGGLDAVAVVHVDVHVQHPAEAAEELVDGEHDVVHVAEAAGLLPARVVQAAGPVDGDLGLAGDERARRGQGPAGVAQAVVPEAGDGGVVDVAAVLIQRADVEALGRARHLAASGEALRGDVVQELDVVHVVEGGDLYDGGGPRAEAGHVAEQAVGADERVRHVDAAGHHEVALAVVDTGDAAVVVVAHAPLRAIGARLRRQRVAAGVHLVRGRCEREGCGRRTGEQAWRAYRSCSCDMRMHAFM